MSGQHGPIQPGWTGSNRTTPYVSRSQEVDTQVCSASASRRQFRDSLRTVLRSSHPDILGSGRKAFFLGAYAEHAGCRDPRSRSLELGSSRPALPLSLTPRPSLPLPTLGLTPHPMTGVKCYPVLQSVSSRHRYTGVVSCPPTSVSTRNIFRT